MTTVKKWMTLSKMKLKILNLYELLLDVKRKFPDVQGLARRGISSGSILSTYQRTRIESVCGRLLYYIIVIFGLVFN